MPVSVDQWRGEVGNFNNRMTSNFLFCTYDICSAYRKLISVMCSLFLASVVMFFQTIINLFLLKSYYKFHSFDITSFEGSELDFLTSQFGLSQIIKEPTHTLDNSRS